MRISGIYKITNNINGKSYIGQSIDIKKRWREHKSASFNKNSKDYDMVIHRAIRKYGKENFSFEILEECNKEELNKKEIEWIEKYDSTNKGYNVSLGGNNYEHLGNVVELYDYNGEYVCEYPNAMEVAKALDVFYGTVYQVIYGIRLSVKGYQLKIKESDKEIKKYKNRQGGKIKVCNLDDNNKVIHIYESAISAARTLGLDASSITKCCKGKLIHHGGFKWSYYNDKEVI